MDEVSSCDGSPTSSTYYLNDSVSGLMAEKIVSGANTTTKDYLFAGGVMVGLRTKVNSGTAAIAYYVLDHLGSVAVTTDEAGALVCRIAYDPWGKSTASGAGCTAPTRGFTGEEQINTGALTNFVNLNARVYDTVLARFMAADPILANPFSGQQNILNAQGFLPPRLDVAATGGIPAYSAIRGREQQLIDFYGGARSIGGTSRNMINGISGINPLGPVYIQSSISAFGALPNNSPGGR